MKSKKFTRFILIGIISVSVILAMFNVSGCKKAGSSGQNHPQVQVEMEDGNTFVIELYPEYAPKTVENFLKLVNDGFYDGLTFHRIIDGFMAQGGGYDASGAEKQADTIPGEFSNNGFTQNTLKHTKGVVSMARIGGMNDSASSEFFIMLDDKEGPGLDGDYAAFGKVIEGMDVITNFQKLDRTVGPDGNISTPVTPVVIKKMTEIKT